MSSHRVGRATEEIRRELSDIMRTLKDPRITGLISIVNMELTNDYSHCTVYISSLDGLEGAETAVQGLQSAAGFIRRELSHRVRMRRIPQFHFVADDGIAYSADIGQKLGEIRAERRKREDDLENN